MAKALLYELGRPTPSAQAAARGTRRWNEVFKALAHLYELYCQSHTDETVTLAMDGLMDAYEE